MNALQKLISNSSTESSTSIEKICPLCQKKFIPKGRQKYCDGPHFKPCPVCGKPVPAPYPSDPAKCCSSECRKKLKDKINSTSENPTSPQLITSTPSVEHEPERQEYPLMAGVELNREPMPILEKGGKAFFTKECVFDSKMPRLIKGHIYDIEVIKGPYTYEVKLTYDHTYREDMEFIFNVGSAISFNHYFK